MSDPATPDVEMADSWWEHRADAFGAWAEQIDPADLEPADTGALQAIARLTDLRREIETAILEAVQHARQQRRTWAEIGAMLGVTRQAAQHKYAPALARLGAGHRHHHTLHPHRPPPPHLDRRGQADGSAV